MTPLGVEILLWYSYSPNDFPGLDSIAAQSEIKRFCELGIMKWLPLNSRDTRKIGIDQDALDVYVNAVLAVPLPKQKWVIENKKP